MLENEVGLKLFDNSNVLDWQILFGNDYPLEVELGCGTGRFILDRAQRYPDRNFVGVEMSSKWYKLVVKRALKRKIPNVRIFWSDCREFVKSNIPENSVLNFHIHFPDPWWKKRHHKRRIFQPRFCADLQKGLVNGGYVYILTDVKDYFDLIVAVMDAHSVLNKVESFHEDSERVITNYEEKALRRSGCIHKVSYRKAEAN